MDSDDLKRFLDQQWQDGYHDLLNALGLNPRAREEPSDCRTFVFPSESFARTAYDQINAIPGAKANLDGKKVSTVQPESLTPRVMDIAEQLGGKMKGFQLSWG